MRKLTFFLLTLMIFSLPWDNAVRFQIIGAFGRLIGLLTLCVAILTVLLDGKFRRINKFHLILSLFILWGINSYFWSISPIDTFNRIFTNIQLLVFVWVIWEFTRTKKQLIVLLQSYILGAFIPVGMLIFNFLMSNSSFIGRYSVAGFNPNFLGIILIVGIIYANYLIQISPNKNLLLINRLYIPISFFAILLTGSRTSLFISLIILIYILLPYFISKGVKDKILIITLLSVTCYFALTSIPETTWQRLGTSFSELKSGEFGDRSNIWDAGLDEIGENLFTGVGVGAFGSLMEDKIGHNVSAHNSFISVLVELGLFGLVIFLIVLIYLVIMILKCPPRIKKMWFFNFVCVFIGMNLLAWEYGKVLWVMFGLIPVCIEFVRMDKNEKGISDL